MPILLSHTSSLERLRSVPPQVDTAKNITQPMQMAQFAQAGDALSEEVLRSTGVVQRPAHRLVPSGRHEGGNDTARIHRLGFEEVPAGLLRAARDDVYYAGPEFTFALMAQATSLIGMVVLGHELCGTYAHFAQFVSGFYERPALTSVERIRGALGELRGLYGISMARRALRWVRDGSASPMETVVSCMLGLPTSMGGFGLVAPVLNYEVALAPAGRGITGTRTCRIDTAYPEVMVGVEFDGVAYHRDVERDRRRREVLAHEGWTIYVLNTEEMLNFSQLRNTVSLLDGVPRLRGSGPVSDAAARELLDRLLRATRFGVGLNAALFGTDVPRGLVRVHL